jgi:REP element-mobilizing transposase RayT
MPQSFVCLNCHFVFSTKDRKPWIVRELASRLYEYFGGTIGGIGGSLLAAGGVPDHVHLLASLGKTTSVADFVRDVKCNSSRWIHVTFPTMAHFGWQNGYGAFAVSYSNLGQVKHYIGNQEEHHRVRSFQEEAHTRGLRPWLLTNAPAGLT